MNARNYFGRKVSVNAKILYIYIYIYIYISVNARKLEKVGEIFVFP